MVRFVRTEKRMCFLGTLYWFQQIDWFPIRYRVSSNEDGSEWEIARPGMGTKKDYIEKVVPAAEVREYVEDKLELFLSKIEWMRMGLREEYLEEGQDDA